MSDIIRIISWAAFVVNPMIPVILAIADIGSILGSGAFPNSEKSIATAKKRDCLAKAAKIYRRLESIWARIILIWSQSCSYSL